MSLTDAIFFSSVHSRLVVFVVSAPAVALAADDVGVGVGAVAAAAGGPPAGAAVARARAEAPAQLLPRRHPGHRLHLRGQDHRRLLRGRAGGVPDVPRLRAGLRVRGEREGEGGQPRER